MDVQVNCRDGLLAFTLDFARRLQTIRHVPGLVAATQDEVRARLGYSASWVCVFEDETLEKCRLWSVSGEQVDPEKAEGLVFSSRDDKMIEEIVRTQRVVIVEDARSDSRTDKNMVAMFHNRTIIHVPLRLLEQPLGVLGLGSFGDEGVRPPSREAIEFLVQIAGHLSVALSRVQLMQQQEARAAEKLRHERILARTQRLESVGILAGGIAHDFNNLLMVILANASMMEHRGLSSAQAENMRSVIGAAERAADLCGRMLALGRKSELRFETLNLSDRVAALLHLLRRVMPHIDVNFVSSRDVPAIRGDGGQLDQVVMNLCLNARDAMPDGGKLSLETAHVVLSEETARAHPWARPGRYVLLCVTDTGSGMPPEVVEHIFEPFFTTKAAGSGTGLGLAVAYSIVRQHNGMLHCYSEVGRGTTFRLYLPAYEPAAENSAAWGRRQSAPRGTGETVLVADDEEAVRELVTRQLEAAGYHVHAVENGELAVQMVSKRAFDLVLLDVMMPTMGGREACERIRELRPETRFLFASGYASEMARADLLAQTHSELVPKPYHDDVLLEAVRRSLDRSL